MFVGVCLFEKKLTSFSKPQVLRLFRFSDDFCVAGMSSSWHVEGKVGGF